MPRGTGFGTVYSESGVYHGRYTGPDGVKYVIGKTSTRKTDVQDWLAEVRADISRGVWKSPKTPEEKGFTFSEYAESFMDRSSRKPKTDAEYDRLLKKHCVPTFGKMKLDAITPLKVGNWYAKLLPDAPTDRAHTYSLFRTIMLSAVREGLIVKSPCVIRGAGSVKRAGKTKLPTPVEVMLAADFMPGKQSDSTSHAATPKATGKCALIVLLAAKIGLRSGEVRALQRQDLDLKERILHVRRNLVRYEGAEHTGTTKTVAGTRDCSIPKELVPLIEEHLKTVGPRDDSWVFLNSKGELLSGQTLNKWWAKARATAGIPDVRFHDLRHYAGTMAVVYGGATEYEAMRMLGQEDSKVLRLYLDEVRGRQREIADNTPSLVSARPLVDAEV